MKAHTTLIEKLIKVYEVYSGWRDQAKLKSALAELNFAVYKRQDGMEILVDKDEMEKLLREQKFE